MSEDIPPLLEEFDAVRLKIQVVWLVCAVFAIGHGYPHPFLHRLNDHLQVVALRRDGLQQYAALEREALADDIVDGESREQPVLHGVLSEHIVVLDEIGVAVLLVASDDDAEHILDGDFMACEGGARNVHSFAHVGVQPSVVDFCQCDSLGPVYGVDEPNIRFEFVLCFHILELIFAQRYMK